MTPDRKDRLFGLSGFGAIAALLVVWEVLGHLDVSFFLPPFSRVARVWLSLMGDGTIPDALAFSAGALVRGFVPAALVGVGLGSLMGVSPVWREAFDPFVNTLMSAPLSALVPVLIAIFGISEAVVAATVFLFSVFVIIVNTSIGIRGTEESLIQMARVFGVSGVSLLWRIYLPRALPAVFLGLRLGLVQAIKGMVVGEMLISVIGLGERLIYYGNTFLIPQLYAVILSVLVVALLASSLVQLADRALIRWE